MTNKFPSSAKMNQNRLKPLLVAAQNFFKHVSVLLTS